MSNPKLPLCVRRGLLTLTFSFTHASCYQGKLRSPLRLRRELCHQQNKQVQSHPRKTFRSGSLLLPFVIPRSAHWILSGWRLQETCSGVQGRSHFFQERRDLQHGRVREPPRRPPRELPLLHVQESLPAHRYSVIHFHFHHPQSSEYSYSERKRPRSSRGVRQLRGGDQALRRHRALPRRYWSRRSHRF